MYVFIKYTLFFLHIITLPHSNYRYNDALTTLSMISTGLSATIQKKKLTLTGLSFSVEEGLKNIPILENVS